MLTFGDIIKKFLDSENDVLPNHTSPSKLILNNLQKLEGKEI